MPTRTLRVDADGNVAAIWSDDMRWLRGEGDCKVTRSSHVEATDDGLAWEPDMSPSRGPKSLGRFETRREALDAEVAWLKRELHL